MNNNEASARARMWLHVLDSSKVDPVPVFPHDYDMLHNLCGITPERVMRNAAGKITVYFVSKTPTVRQLKAIYGFFTKAEATQELKEASDGSNL